MARFHHLAGVLYMAVGAVGRPPANLAEAAVGTARGRATPDLAPPPFSFWDGASALPPHPRLLADDAAIAALRAGILRNDSGLGTYYSALLSAGEAAMLAPVTPYINCTVVGACRNAAVFGAGANYINTGNAADAILPTALLHRLNLTQPSVPWADRAITELLHLSGPGFPSWYWPVGQALERSAMAFAVAVGYDWLYPILSPAQRSSIEAGIGSKALLTRLQDERQGMWWTQDPLNWNINSNGPLAAAALAVADAPGWASPAAQVISIAAANMPAAVASWAPFGIWPEGPSYLSFTLGSQVQAASALRTATGSDGGLLSAPGVCEVGTAIIYHTGPSGAYFNWGDAHAGSVATPPLFYSAASCGRPEYAAFGRAMNALGGAGPRRLASGGSGSALDLLWYTDAGSWSSILALPLSATFADPSLDTLRGRKTHFGSFRSCWAFGVNGAAEGCTSPVWLAFKGGENHFDDHGSQSHNNHGHLDVSTFVLESGPEHVRWAVDLGPGQYDYPLLSYFGRFRFGYHYLSSAGHNVLSFDGDTQHRRGSGGIVAANTTGGAEDAWATVETTTVHGGAVFSTRTYEMATSGPTTTVVITDAWSHPTATTATWTMHTTASVSLEGSAATLTSPSGRSSIKLDVSAGGGAGAKPRTSASGGGQEEDRAHSAVPVAWNVSLLTLPVPQESTYGDGLPVYVLTASVPASAGALAVTFTPLN